MWQIQHDGQISSVLQKWCQAPQIKNISLHASVNQNYKLCHPGPHEGRIMIVTTRRAGDAMDALASGAFLRRTKTPKRTAKSCGPGAAMLALSWREVSRR